MITLENNSNSLVINVDTEMSYIVPKGKAIAVQSDDADTVDNKLVASRKTLISLKASNVEGYTSASASDLANALKSML